jgi:flavin-dependent dehydrogenase
MRIAISGARIAGTALAYWLKRYGHEPVLIEKAPNCAPQATLSISGTWSDGNGAHGADIAVSANRDRNVTKSRIIESISETHGSRVNRK